MFHEMTTFDVNTSTPTKYLRVVCRTVQPNANTEYRSQFEPLTSTSFHTYTPPECMYVCTVGTYVICNVCMYVRLCLELSPSYL